MLFMKRTSHPPRSSSGQGGGPSAGLQATATTMSGSPSLFRFRRERRTDEADAAWD